MNNEFVERPPLGVMPEFIWREQRLVDLHEAICRFLEARQLVPEFMYREEKEHQQWLDSYRQKKEQLKPKEWEVIEFRHQCMEYILSNDGGYNRKHLEFAARLSHIPKNIEIKSVRRLSDNEVFTIGDSVTVTSKTSQGWDRNPIHKIYAFGLNDDKSMFVCLKTDTPVCGDIELGNRTNAYKSGVFDLNDFKKAKQPLFTKEQIISLLTETLELAKNKLNNT